jgi:hypothetical protein
MIAAAAVIVRQQEAEQHDDPDEQRELVPEHVAEVDEHGGLTADEHVQAAAALGRGHDLRAKPRAGAPRSRHPAASRADRCARSPPDVRRA